MGISDVKKSSLGIGSAVGTAGFNLKKNGNKKTIYYYSGQYGVRNQSKKEAIAIVSCAGQREDVAARQRSQMKVSYKQNGHWPFIVNVYMKKYKEHRKMF